MSFWVLKGNIPCVNMHVKKYTIQLFSLVSVGAFKAYILVFYVGGPVLRTLSTVFCNSLQPENGL